MPSLYITAFLWDITARPTIEVTKGTPRFHIRITVGNNDVNFGLDEEDLVSLKEKIDNVLLDN